MEDNGTFVKGSGAGVAGLQSFWSLLDPLEEHVEQWSASLDDELFILSPDERRGGEHSVAGPPSTAEARLRNYDEILAFHGGSLDGSEAPPYPVGERACDVCSATERSENLINTAVVAQLRAKCTEDRWLRTLEESLTRAQKTDGHWNVPFGGWFQRKDVTRGQTWGVQVRAKCKELLFGELIRFCDLGNDRVLRIVDFVTALTQGKLDWYEREIGEAEVAMNDCVNDGGAKKRLGGKIGGMRKEICRLKRQRDNDRTKGAFDKEAELEKMLRELSELVESGVCNIAVEMSLDGVTAEGGSVVLWCVMNGTMYAVTTMDSFKPLLETAVRGKIHLPLSKDGYGGGFVVDRRTFDGVCFSASGKVGSTVFVQIAGRYRAPAFFETRENVSGRAPLFLIRNERTNAFTCSEQQAKLFTEAREMGHLDAKGYVTLTTGFPFGTVAEFLTEFEETDCNSSDKSNDNGRNMA